MYIHFVCLQLKQDVTNCLPHTDVYMQVMRVVEGDPLLDSVHFTVILNAVHTVSQYIVLYYTEGLW